MEAIVDAPLRYRGRGYYASIRYIQRRSEILGLASAVREARPKVIVEIGSCLGGTLYIFCRSNPQAELIISIDLPGGAFGGGSTSQLAELFSHFAFDRPNTTIATIRDNSHSDLAISRLRHLLQGKQIDFLYLDADHTYDGVSSDFKRYAQFVRPGGLIAFHDIFSEDPAYGVPRLWAELSTSYPTVEFRDGPESTMGNGMLTYTPVYRSSHIGAAVSGAS